MSLTRIGRTVPALPGRSTCTKNNSCSPDSDLNISPSFRRRSSGTFATGGTKIPMFSSSDDTYACFGGVRLRLVDPEIAFSLPLDVPKGVGDGNVSGSGDRRLMEGSHI